MHRVLRTPAQWLAVATAVMAEPAVSARPAVTAEPAASDQFPAPATCPSPVTEAMAVWGVSARPVVQAALGAPAVPVGAAAY
jgi:hypothetical protein